MTPLTAPSEDQLLEVFRQLPPELQRQALKGLEQLVQGVPGDLARLFRLAEVFAALSRDVSLRRRLQQSLRPPTH